MRETSVNAGRRSPAQYLNPVGELQIREDNCDSGGCASSSESPPLSNGALLPIDERTDILLKNGDLSTAPLRISPPICRRGGGHNGLLQYDEKRAFPLSNQLPSSPVPNRVTLSSSASPNPTQLYSSSTSAASNVFTFLPPTTQYSPPSANQHQLRLSVEGSIQNINVPQIKLAAINVSHFKVIRTFPLCNCSRAFNLTILLL